MPKHWFDFFKSVAVVVASTAALAAEPVHVGDLTLLGPGKARMDVPVPASSGHPGEQELERGWALVERDGKSWIVWVQPGEIQVPAITLLDENGKPVQQVPPMQVQVQSSLDPKAGPSPQPDPPYGLMRLGLPPAFWIGVILLVLVLLAGIIWAAVRWSRRARAKVAEPVRPEVIKTPEQLALEQLHRLQEQKIYQSGEYKKYAFSISEVLKRYYGKKFQFDAEESTTAELLRALKKRTRWHDDQWRLIENELALLDRMKFTDWVPPSESCLEAIQKAIELVEAGEEGKRAF